MNARQKRAKALNARLNYLIDNGLSAEEIMSEMNTYPVTINFIRNIIIKRSRK